MHSLESLKSYLGGLVWTEARVAMCVAGFDYSEIWVRTLPCVDHYIYARAPNGVLREIREIAEVSHCGVLGLKVVGRRRCNLTWGLTRLGN